MKLTIKNVGNVGFVHGHKVNVEEVAESLYDTYNFKFEHYDYSGKFQYTLHREIKVEDKWVGTLKHPNGSYRLDCYEMDILDKQSFLDFLSIAVHDWDIQYNK